MARYEPSWIQKLSAFVSSDFPSQACTNSIWGTRQTTTASYVPRTSKLAAGAYVTPSTSMARRRLPEYTVTRRPRCTRPLANRMAHCSEPPAPFLMERPSQPFLSPGMKPKPQ